MCCAGHADNNSFGVGLFYLLMVRSFLLAVGLCCSRKIGLVFFRLKFGLFLLTLENRFWRGPKGYLQKGYPWSGRFLEISLRNLCIKCPKLGEIWPIRGYPFCGYPFWSCPNLISVWSFLLTVGNPPTSYRSLPGSPGPKSKQKSAAGAPKV